MKTKKMILLFVALICVQHSSWAQTKVQIGDLYYNLSGITATVACNFDESWYKSFYQNDEYIIPEYIEYDNDKFSVTGIDSYAFSYLNVYSEETCPAKKIILPSSILNIGEHAFAGCNKLKSMIIPHSVIKFEGLNFGGTFNNCPLLRELIYLPKSAPQNWTATTFTYVPDINSYSTPSFSINDAHIIEMITFDQTEYEYTGQVPNTTWKNNVEGYTASLSFSTLSGEVGDHEEWIPVTFTKGDESFTANVVYRYTVKPAKITAKVSNASREYGEENPQFKITYTGFVYGEDENNITTLPTASTIATNTSNVGDYPITISDGSATNYEFEYEPGVLTITKASLAAMVKSSTKVYGDENPTFSIEYYGLKNEEATPAWTSAPTFETDATKTSSVGTYTVSALDGSPQNYELDKIVSGTLSISPAPLIIKAKTYIWKQDEIMPELTLTYEGFKNEETNKVLTKQPTVITTASKNSEPGDYEVTVSGAEAENYEISYVNGTIKVIEGDPVTTEDVITIKDTGKTTWCSKYDLDFTNVEGVKAYTATGYNNITKTIWLTRVMEVPAGTGILVKGDAGTYKIPHAEVQSAYANWFVGNLGDAIKIEETDGDKTNYYLSGKDGTFKSVNGSANIGKNKAYLQLPTSVFGGTRSIGISYDDEDGTTSIKDLTPALSEGEGAWYTLQGQRVAKPGKGLYIHNGKKVVIK